MLPIISLLLLNKQDVNCKRKGGLRKPKYIGAYSDIQHTKGFYLFSSSLDSKLNVVHEINQCFQNIFYFF